MLYEVRMMEKYKCKHHNKVYIENKSVFSWLPSSYSWICEKCGKESLEFLMPDDFNKFIKIKESILLDSSKEPNKFIRIKEKFEGIVNEKIESIKEEGKQEIITDKIIIGIMIILIIFQFFNLRIESISIWILCSTVIISRIHVILLKRRLE